MRKERINELSDAVRTNGLALHKFLKHGHSEKVYENGLKNRLRKDGVKVEQQFPISVFDEDGTPLGEFFADLLVEDEVIVELKAVRAITDEHVAQLLGYLRATGRSYGLLVNFGAPTFFIKRYILT